MFFRHVPPANRRIRSVQSAPSRRYRVRAASAAGYALVGQVVGDDEIETSRIAARRAVVKTRIMVPAKIVH